MANEQKTVDPGRSRLTQEAFARNPPTAEDNYFHEEEERRLHPVKLGTPPTPATSTGPGESVGLLERLYRAVARAFNPDWRP
jgi:hypothetical protein